VATGRSGRCWHQGLEGDWEVLGVTGRSGWTTGMFDGATGWCPTGRIGGQLGCLVRATGRFGGGKGGNGGVERWRDGGWRRER